MTRKPDDDKDREPLGFGGLLNSLSSLFETVKDMAEQETGPRKEGDPLHGIFGFNIRTLLDEAGERIRVEPFGNVRRDAEGKTAVHEVREPMVDVFEEDDHVLILAEMPGVGDEDVRVELEEDLLFIEAARGDRKYRKEVLLSAVYVAQQLSHTCNNGILQVRIMRSR